MADRTAVAVACALGATGALAVVIVAIYLTGWAPRWLLSLEARLFRSVKRRKQWSWDRVDERVFIGSLPRWPEQLAELRAHGVGAVLSLNETWELAVSAACVRDDCGMAMRQLPTADFFAPSQRDLVEAVAFIDRHARAGTGVYVHCNGGRGRSAVAVICYLIYARGETADSAFALVRAARRIANLRALCGLRTQWRAVRTFERELRAARAELARRGVDGHGLDELFAPPRGAERGVGGAVRPKTSQVVPAADEGPALSLIHI